MTQNYRDICEFDQGPGSEDNTEENSGAGSVPTWVEFGPGSSTASGDAIDLLYDPNENLEDNRFSPTSEILRGLVDTASRTVTLIPQSRVYNFPLQTVGGNILAVGLKEYDFNDARAGVSLYPKPSLNSGDYITTGQKKESIAATAADQDTLRFVAGKVFYVPAGQLRENFINFQLLNQNEIQSQASAEGAWSLFTNRYLKSSIVIKKDGGLQKEFENNKLVRFKQNLKIGFGTPKASVEFALRQDYSVRELENYLLDLIPKPNKKFLGGVIQAPAALFKSELNFVSERPEACYANVSVRANFTELRQSVYEIDDGILEFENNDYYQVRNKTRRDKKSVYSKLLSLVDTPVLPILTEADGTEIPVGIIPDDNDCLVVEKFSSYRVKLMQDINSIITSRFVREDSQDTARMQWIDDLSPISVEIEFSEPRLSEQRHGPIATGDEPLNALMVNHGLDNMFLTLLNLGWDGLAKSEFESVDSDFNTLYAYSLDQNWTDTTIGEDELIDFYTDRENDYTPNEKIEYNFRPRVYDDFLKMICGPFENVLNVHQSYKARLTRRLYDYVSEFPLLYERSQNLLIVDNNGIIKQNPNNEPFIEEFDRLSNSVSEFKTALYQKLNFTNEFGIGNRYLPTSIGEFFDGFVNKMCILAFRIEKVNSYTGKVVKEFYLFNNPEVQEFKFFDSEVSESEKYRYNIYTVNFVAGYKYCYTDHRMIASPETPQQPVNFSRIGGTGWGEIGTNGVPAIPSTMAQIQIEPHLKIVEIPFFSQEVTILDTPPLPPSVNLDKLGLDENNRREFRLRLAASIGKIIETPVAILDSDEEIISKMQTSQLFTKPPEAPQGTLVYSSDTAPQEFEMLVLSEPPLNYDSFSEARVHRVSGDAPFFTFSAPVNSPRYMVFRTHDRGGLSNPTKMYRFLYNSYGDGEYHEFDVYEPELEAFQQPLEITCERYLSIEPSQQQATMNFGVDLNSTQAEIQQLLNSDREELSVNDVSLGHIDDDEAIWNKDFKIRLRSTSTGRIIDLNFKFIVDKIDLSMVRDDVDLERSLLIDSCGDFINQKNLKIREKIEKSAETLRERLTSGEDDGDVY